ncbi:MAG: hypothetical protein V3V31_16115 [Methylococcales bacterium]
MISKFRKSLWILPLLMTSGMVQAISIGFNPVSQSVTTGDTIITDVVISDLGSGAAPSIGTYDLDITFDDSHLSFVSTSFGNQLDLFGLGSTASDILTGAGVLNLFELSFDLPADLDALQADSFSLATLTFDVLTTNSSALGIVVNALGDSLANPLTADVAAGNITSTDLTVTVPEPAVLLLLLPGLIALGITARNK